jgi:hypothetical protein
MNRQSRCGVATRCLWSIAATIAAASLGCLRASYEASDRALWLKLRDPTSRVGARAELEQSMRDPDHSLRRLPLALQFGLKLDLQVVEAEIDRQDALSGGSSPDAALARFSMAFTKKNQREAAEYIDKYREQLFRYLNPAFLTLIEVQMLAQSGQIELAERRIEQSSSSLGVNDKDRLARIIVEAKASNPIEARERQFNTSDALTDLAGLVEVLENHKDWPRLVKYAQIFFDRTRDVSACRLFASALFETGDFQGVVDLLRRHGDLVDHSAYLESLLAWSLYRIGDVKDCNDVLNSLRSKRNDPNDRVLTVSLAIASGDWLSLLAFIEQEWAKRDERDAEEMLRSGQLAHHVGSPRGKALIFEAARKAPDDPKILIGCYSVAVSAGWEDETTAAWMERGASLSGDDGPIKKVTLKELSELQPDWQQRQSRTAEQLTLGAMPTFMAARLLNRSLVDMYLLPALANAETVDPRRRSLIFAFSGARNAVQGTPNKVAFDPTALLTLGALDLIDTVFDGLEKIVVLHSTLAWLFEERQRIQFHQPSRIADAQEIKRLLDTKALREFSGTVRSNTDLAAELGDELAAFFAEAELGSEDHQRPPHQI